MQSIKTLGNRFSDHIEKLSPTLSKEVQEFNQMMNSLISENPDLSLITSDSVDKKIFELIKTVPIDLMDSRISKYSMLHSDVMAQIIPDEITYMSEYQVKNALKQSDIDHKTLWSLLLTLKKKSQNPHVYDHFLYASYLATHPALVNRYHTIGGMTDKQRQKIKNKFYFIMQILIFSMMVFGVYGLIRGMHKFLNVDKIFVIDITGHFMSLLTSVIISGVLFFGLKFYIEHTGKIPDFLQKKSGKSHSST